MIRQLLAVTAVAAVGVPVAAAQPSRFSVDTTLAPGERAMLTVGKVPRGEFRFALRASGAGEKLLGLTQQRGVVRKFPVLNVPSPLATSACRTFASSLLCRDITTPAPVAGSTYTFRLRNKGDQPMRVVLTVLWRAVASAG